MVVLNPFKKNKLPAACTAALPACLPLRLADPEPAADATSYGPKYKGLGFRVFGFRV